MTRKERVQILFVNAKGHEVPTSVVTNEKALLVRIDRIGDLALTLPSDQVLRERGIQTKWLIGEGLGFLPQLAIPARPFYEVAREFSITAFVNLVKWLKSEQFSQALVFHGPWWVSLALWWAGVPWRGGRRSQWHSFLFLNKGIRQSRLHGEWSELDYNIELVAKSFSVEFRPRPLLLESKSAVINRYNLDKYFVVHPGMSGSARNWSPSNFSKLIMELSQYGQVVVTGTKADAPYLTQVQPQVQGRCLWLVDQLKPDELIALLSHAKLVIAPSTGVAHLAAATGVLTIGIYSPVRSQSATRWGPKGERVMTITPQVDCPAIKECLGEACPYFDCMDRVTVTDLIERIKSAGVL